MTAAPVAAGEPPVSAVGVVVPARDEEERIGRCLHSVRHALAALPADIAVAVAVVLDRCSDTTPRRVAALIVDWPDAQVVPATGRSSMRPAGSGVGGLRDLGLRHVLARLAPHPPAGTWLLSTDADTTVPADWARAHLGCAAAGAHAVAGLADLTTAEPLAADVLLRYRAIVDDGVRGATHHHVYGANLGVRADAYLAVGGFPRAGAGEDHGLWRRLRAAGYALAQPVGLRVQTSARLDGRAEGGLAHLLRSLHDSSLHDSSLHDSSLHDSSLHDSSLHDSSLHDSSLHDSSLHDSSLHDSSLHDSSLQDTTAEGGSAVPQDAARDPDEPRGGA